MGALKVRDPATGTWIVVGTQGPPGEDGEQGVSSVIVGSFGAVQTPAGLPPDGLLPIDWDGPGKPAAPFQMEQGWSLYYDKPTDPLDGHLFQHIGTGIDPTGWLDIGLIQGPAGPEGPEGPVGPPDDEVWVGPDTPPEPTMELWFDTDDDRLLGATDLPPGGTAGQPLVKTTDIDGDVGWDAATLDISHGVNMRGTNMGIVWPGGTSRIYERDGYLVLRKGTSNTQPKVHNNDASNQTDILTANGFASMTAALKMGTFLGPKIKLYDSAANEYGIGMESGQMVFYVPNDNKMSFKGVSTTGTEWAFIDKNGLGPRTNIDGALLNGWVLSRSGTDMESDDYRSCKFRVNPAMVSVHLNIQNPAGIGGNSASKICAYPTGVPAPFERLIMTAWQYSPAMGSMRPLFIEARGDGLYLVGGNGYTYDANANLTGSLTWSR